MTTPFYVGPEQLFRDKSEYARRNISRGRSVVALTYEHGILFVAENHSSSLHKISEIYDRIGFAAVGRYNEFENLRVAGVQYADTRGYAYDRRDVSGRGLANRFAQLLGQVFIESAKPFEVELVVAEVGDSPETDSMYRLVFDGSLVEERNFVAMGGHSDTMSATLRENHQVGQSLTDAMRAALAAIQAGAVAAAGPNTDVPPAVSSANLEVGVLDRTRPRRKFRRITGEPLAELVTAAGGTTEPGEQTESASAE